MVIFQNLSKNGEMLKNVDENIKQIFIALIIFNTLDIKNIILTQSFTNIFCHLYSLVLSWSKYFLYFWNIWSPTLYLSLFLNIIIVIIFPNTKWKLGSGKNSSSFEASVEKLLTRALELRNDLKWTIVLFNLKV